MIDMILRRLVFAGFFCVMVVLVGCNGGMAEDDDVVVNEPLGFRIAVTSEGVDGNEPLLDEGEIAKYKTKLEKKGGGCGKADFCWLPVAADFPVPEEVVTSEIEGVTYLLVCNTPEYAMAIGDERLGGWYLERAKIVEGFAKREVLSLEFDAKGKEKLGKLTEGHQRYFLAMVFDGQVEVIAKIFGKLSGQVELKGNWSAEEMAEVARKLNEAGKGAVE